MLISITSILGYICAPYIAAVNRILSNNSSLYFRGQVALTSREEPNWTKPTRSQDVKIDFLLEIQLDVFVHRHKQMMTTCMCVCVCVCVCVVNICCKSFVFYFHKTVEKLILKFQYIHLLFVNRQHNKENTKIRKEVVNKIAIKYEHYIHGRISSRANTTKTKNQTRSLRAIQLIIH